jgi:hypothetical protein
LPLPLLPAAVGLTTPAGRATTLATLRSAMLAISHLLQIGRA